MKRLMALLLVVAVLAACVPPTPTPVVVEKEVVVEKVVTPTPIPKPAVFHGAGGWDPPPAYHGNPFAPGGVGAAWWYVFEPVMVYVPGTGELLPRLGISYEETPEAITVKLRENAKWHDGTPFTSKDVRTSWMLAKQMWGWPPLIKDVETPDDYTAVFRWEKPTPLGKALLGAVVISAPYHIYGKFLEEIEAAKTTEEADAAKDKVREFRPELPVGIGPFTVKTVTASEMILEKFPEHYAADKVDFDGIKIVRWTSNEVMWAFLIAGEIDAAHPATIKDVTEEIMRTQPATKLALPTDLGEFVIALNLEKYPFSEQKFRQALIYALDRSQIREVSYYYALTVDKYAHGVLKSFEDVWLSPDFLAELEPYTYDPTKAEAILTEMGWSKGSDGFWRDAEGKLIELEINAAAANSDWVLAAENIATQLTNFGLKTEYRGIPNEVYGPTLRAGDYQMAIEFGTAWWGFAHPWAGYDRLFSATGYMKDVTNFPDEVTGPEGETVVLDDLVMDLSVEFDPAKQKELVEKLAWITNEYLPVIPFLEKKLMIFHLDGVRVTGWPDPEDPLWLLSPGGIERFYSELMIEGKLKAVR